MTERDALMMATARGATRYEDWQVGMVYDLEHDRDGWRAAAEQYKSERDAVRRRVKECEFALKVMDAVLEEVDPISRVSYEHAVNMLRKALR